MSYLEDKILHLSKQLYPTGRAFKVTFGSYFEKLNKGLIKSEARAYEDALSTLNSALPDNEDFTTEDATAWERRLGLITNEAVPLSNRMQAIIRKMNHPGTIKARQNFRFLEKQLRDAGFDVYVYENRFPDGLGGYDTQTPESLSGSSGAGAQHGDIQHGDAQHGVVWNQLVANHIDENIDADFYIGENFRSTFFIGGSPIGSYANVPIARKDEFRQLILRVKPDQTVAFLFIQYTSDGIDSQFNYTLNFQLS